MDFMGKAETSGWPGLGKIRSGRTVRGEAPAGSVKRLTLQAGASCPALQRFRSFISPGHPAIGLAALRRHMRMRLKLQCRVGATFVARKRGGCVSVRATNGCVGGATNRRDLSAVLVRGYPFSSNLF